MRDIEQIIKTFKEFTGGDRILMLIQRSKENGATNTDRSATKKISRNPDEFRTILAGFLENQAKSEEPLRIYSSVNKRSFEKAVRLFKFRMLEADYYDVDSRQSFYVDISNRWISCFASPEAREETKFLFDVDGDVTSGGLKENLVESGAEILLEYLTKNGMHIITNPFNPTNLKAEYKKILKKDGVLLLAY